MITEREDSQFVANVREAIGRGCINEAQIMLTAFRSTATILRREGDSWRAAAELAQELIWEAERADDLSNRNE